MGDRAGDAAGAGAGDAAGARTAAGDEWMAFLQWAAPRLHLRWRGFRNVRGQVEKRIARRMRALGLASLAAYRARLDEDAAEWAVLDDACRVTISRFYRDRGVFDALAREVLPRLAERARARGDGIVRAWSAGCASGEEPYTLAIVWRAQVAPRVPGTRLRLLATDSDETVLARARAGRYPKGTLRELPGELVEAAFTCDGDCVLAPELRAGVDFRRQDLRRELPDERFDLILCRNLAFTYFDPPLQEEMLARFAARLSPDGWLVIGRHEALPPSPSPSTTWTPLHPGASILQPPGARG